jgi:hypothetical protein
VTAETTGITGPATPLYFYSNMVDVTSVVTILGDLSLKNHKYPPILVWRKYLKHHWARKQIFSFKCIDFSVFSTAPTRLAAVVKPIPLTLSPC